MTGPSLDSTAPGFLAADPTPRRRASRVWAAWRLLACAWLGAAVLACGGGGGSEGGGSSDGGGDGDPPLATEPVDLPPGQTVAELAWEASDGLVANYLVFVSRNHGGFDFNQVVPSPSVEIPGVAGDEIRITVVAVGRDDDLSEASPPSVEIRFHPADAAAAAATAELASNDPVPAIAIGTSVDGSADDGASAPADGGSLTPDDSTPASDSGVLPGEGSDDGSDDGSQDGSPDGSSDPSPGEVLLTRAVRDRLLRADARLPLAGPAALAEATDAGAAWLAAQVESEVMAGVRLIGTAERAEGALRDLVWRDAFGQLFISDGTAALEADETSTTLVATIRLGVTERFVALADVDGDGLREWITEDTTTAEVWLRSDDSTPARAANRPAAARLLGCGEFDGAGAQELLWQNADGTLSLERPSGAGPVILAGALPPLGTELIAIADLNGDGRDDLIARAEDGQLALGETVLDDPTGGFWIEWTGGYAGADIGAAFVGTLDLDLDGRAEIAWLVGDAVEVRAIGETTPQAFEF